MSGLVGALGRMPVFSSLSRCTGQVLCQRVQRKEDAQDRDERDVVVKAAVGAFLEVVEAERVLELAVVVLHPQRACRAPRAS